MQGVLGKTGSGSEVYGRRDGSRREQNTRGSKVVGQTVGESGESDRRVPFRVQGRWCESVEWQSAVYGGRRQVGRRWQSEQKVGRRQAVQRVTVTGQAVQVVLRRDRSDGASFKWRTVKMAELKQ